MHTDKKERLAMGSMSTKRSALADKNAIWIDQTPGVIEEGKIFFFYRPRKGLPEAHDIGDIQHFFIVMMPLSRTAPTRLIVVGKKRLPEKGQRFWAAVLAAAPSMDDVLEGLGPKEDKGSAAGLIQPARLVGEGIYLLFDDGRSVDMLYELEVPEYPHEAQEQLGIYKTREYTVQVKNPYKASPPGLGLSRKPEYPPELQKEFEGPPGGYSWIPPRNPALLDYAHTEFVLIGREHDIARKHKSLKELLDDAVTRDITLGDLDNATDEDATLIKKVKADVHANEYFIDITRAAEGVMK